MPKVSIIYLTWSGEPYSFLEKALGAVVEQTYAKQSLELVIVYNSHRPDEQSALPYIQKIVTEWQDKLPTTKIVAQDKNLGFTGGNNAGIIQALDGGAQYVFLHNADGFLEKTAIAKLVEAMETDKNIAQLQSLLLLYPEKNLINSAGNARHYLGFGFCTKYREHAAGFKAPQVTDIGYASGAATMLRADLLKKYGLLNEDLFLYHEDTEYSLRLILRGYRVALAGESIFYHEYTFNKNTSKFYWLERNRHAVAYMYYKWPTLILLAPIEFGYNVALLFVALKGGWFWQLIKSYTYWLSPNSWKLWAAIRQTHQAERKVSDRTLIMGSRAMFLTGELVVPKTLSGMANILFTFYYYLLILLVWW